MIIGVLADTHVPEQLARIPAQAMEVLRDRSVSTILHAGDICHPSVLRELSEIAPVVAVRGNRDLLWPGNWKLPYLRVVEFEGMRVGLIHGHPGLGAYLRGKLALKQRFDHPQSIEQRLARRFAPPVSVIVYGHSHIPRVERVGGVLMLNPGSLAPAHFTNLGATLALLKIEGGAADAEIVSVG
jgi:putative phosphoesterase